MNRLTPRPVLLGLVVSLLAARPIAAWSSPNAAGAKSKSSSKSDKGFHGDEVQLEPDSSAGDSGVPAGAAENPTAPKVVGESDTGAEKKAAPAGPKTYPLELVKRPITLLRGMFQGVLDAPLNVSPAVGTPTLALAYGVTDRIQVGIDYGLGGFNSSGYSTGKAASVEAIYKFYDAIGVQLAVPMLFSPYAMAVVIGAPIKLQVGDKLAIEAGRDFLTIRAYRFVPDLANPFNDQKLAQLDKTNTALSHGQVLPSVEVFYQASPKVAVGGELAVKADDFKLAGAPVLLSASLNYSPSPKVDVGARLGDSDLAHAGDNFNLAAYLGLRM